MHLEEIHSPEDIRTMSYDELTVLAGEIREKLVTTVSRRGGHLASNLGIVELTLAIHRVFNTPEDKLVFDVGHQSYVHKLLTGRYARFDTLRSFGGLSGFPKRSESEYDVFETGHASTAISAALGLARARDYQGLKHNVIAVVGDGALTGGMCYEALNDAGSSNTRLIVIVNDNEMSIAPNVGALSRHLTDLRISKGWNSTKTVVKSRLAKIPVVGRPIYHLTDWTKKRIKSAFVDEGFFGSLGFHYFGPISGHDQKSLERTLRSARDYDGPLVVHVLTQKGHGYDKAEQRPDLFHGTPPFYIETGDVKKRASLPSFGKVMAQELAEMAEEDPRIVTITAAMASGTGLDHFAKKHPERLLDVGIAEEHAVTMAAGMAAGGMRPYFAVYASFFQRCCDQLVHDVCMQNLPVTFLLDRAGLVGQDGATHHGIFDLAETLFVPNLTVLAPRDIHELRAMIRWSIRAKGPVAIRYGRDSVDMSIDYPYRGAYQPGKWEQLEQGDDVALLAMGSMVDTAVETARLLRKEGIRAAVINCSSVKPLDESMLRTLSGRPVVTMEEHVLSCGFGAAVNSFCVAEALPAPLMSFGIPDTFVQHGRRDQLLRFLGLQPAQMALRIRIEWEALKR